MQEFDYQEESANDGRISHLALTLGLCAFAQKSLNTVISYQNLLTDELEQQGKLSEYSEKSSALTQRILQVVQSLNPILPGEKQTAERLNLISFCEGVAKQFGGNAIDFTSEIGGHACIQASLFQLQALFYDIWQCLAQIQRAGKWSLRLSQEEFSKLQRSQLNLSGDGEAVFVLALLQDNELPGIPQGFVPLLEALELGGTSAFSTQQILAWTGSMLALGGNVLFSPEHPGAGLVFLFPVPAQMPVDNSPVLQYDSANNDKTILLVDDEDMIWDVISAMLQELGYRVILAENGREAVEIYQSNPGEIDLVLLDMIMPAMSGTEAFFLLKKIDPNVAVLLSSGYVAEDEIQEVLNAGAAGFLRKPYHMTDLAKKIREILA